MSGTKMNLRTLQSDPAAFRRAILIDADGGPVRLGDVLDDWQAADFATLDAAWQRVAGQQAEPSVQRAYLERPRGHSKTGDIATSVAWVLFASRRKLSGVVASGDKEQAGLIRDAIDRLLRLNPWLGEVLEVQRDKVINRHTGSELAILSSDAPTSYGLTPDFVICDELTHWAKPDLWHSLLSATAKRKHCLLLVIANAGFMESWQWEVREAIRTDPAWYFHRLDGPQASWIRPEHLAEQQRLLPAKVFRRLWLNEWSAGAGDALDADEIEAAVTLPGALPRPEPGWCYFGALDIGLRRDSTAFVVLGKHVGYLEKIKKPPVPRSRVLRVLQDLEILPEPSDAQFEYRQHAGTGMLKLAAVRVWKPQSGQRLDLAYVEREIVELHRRFGLAQVAFDVWQAEYLAQRLQRQGIRTEAVPFTASRLQEMTTATLDAFRERRIELYPHADLLSDLRSLRVVEKSYGYRLESPRRGDGDGTAHGDTATALAIALRTARHLRASSALAQQRQLVLYP